MLSVENNNYTKIVYMDVGNLMTNSAPTTTSVLIEAEETNFSFFKTPDLVEVLEINDVYEPEEESNHRIHVLK